MSVDRRQVLVLTVTILMLAGSSLPAAGSRPGEDGGRGGGFGPFADVTDWTDPLDDMSYVYVPTGGLVGVEVSGGNAHLEAGSTEGWIASEVIIAPEGHRYDLVLIEATTPGNSRVEVSILNASKEAGEIGFANDTVPNFKLRSELDLDVYGINPMDYPKIRIQVNLYADGTDRPTLDSWSVFFISLDEWRDEFRGSSKMKDHDGLNFTGDNLEINLTGGMSGGGGTGNYEKFPIISSPAWASISVFYPNAGRTGYLDRDSLTSSQAWGVEIAHLNDDAYMDLIYAERGGTSKIFWGTATGYTNGNSFDLTTGTAQKVAAGDFDGDGWNDIAFACGAADSRVFFNNGDGTFNAVADTTWASLGYGEVSAGDVTGDGYDDVIFGTSSGTHVYYGSETGPGGTRDVSLLGIVSVAKDVDRDGIDDVITRSSSVVQIYLGGNPDIDTTVDYSLNPGATIYSTDAGDINGDGDVDIVVLAGVNPNYKSHIFEGSDGWTSSRVHSTTPGGWGRLACADLDKDGYDDIVLNRWVSGTTYKMDIFKGVSTWPTTAWVTKDTSYAYDLAFAIPRGAGGGTRAYRGTFETNQIQRPLTHKWDILALEGTLPQNTTMTLSVMDSSGLKVVPGYEDLSDWYVDLSDVQDVFINIKVKITSEFNWTTPSLDRLTVKWMDPMTWRDEMYGMAKVDRLLNLQVSDLTLTEEALGGSGPQLIFPSIRGDEAYDTRSMAFFDSGGLDYVSGTPWTFKTRGASAVDVADVNGDGFEDMAFAVHRITNTTFGAKSPIFYGTSIGIRDEPDHEFDTTGALDVLLEDLDDDGHVDVVFAQELIATDDYIVNSLLFWGREDGTWPSLADVEFNTTGASDVDAVDVDGDGLLDLVFANHKGTSFTTDSMVFLQNATGFNGTSPSFLLETRGARGVAAGDLNGDDLVDLVFANSFSGGFTEIDSYIYWGKSGGGFMTTPTGLPTVGAADVKVADLDGDTHLDIVFANNRANTGTRAVDAYIYFNDGTGGFPSTPDTTIPTTGAVAVEVADLDGTGYKDLVFACDFDGVSYSTNSTVFLGGPSGWASSPDLLIPTVGAGDVALGHLVRHGSGAYMSKVISVDKDTTGSFNTFKYTADLGAGRTGEVRLVDALTWEVLASTSMQTGTAVEWDVVDLVKVKVHDSIRVMLVFSGMDTPGDLQVDDLWLNWTTRVKRPPAVLDVVAEDTSVLRGDSLDLRVNVSDEYDLAEELVVTIQHRVNGTGTWDSLLISELKFRDGSWWATILPRLDASVGSYDFRFTAEDKDAQYSPWLEFPNLLEVLNNLPTVPNVQIMPAYPVSTSTLLVEITKEASDLESPGVSYHYSWFKNGVLQENLTENSVSFVYTVKGQNWSVEVRAFDGDDEGPPATVWNVINNAAPGTKNPLPDPELYEDTPDSDWLNLANAFEDADGDKLIWTVVGELSHLEVTIDPETGQVTIVPEADWSGEEDITFSASDGSDGVTQKVTVTVLPVNDIPWISSVDGEPVASDPMEYTVKQGQVLVISIGVMDKEGHDILMEVNNTKVVLDEVARTITFAPDNTAVGTFRFGLKIFDTEDRSMKVSLNFTIVIEDENDEMDVPQITNPLSGAKYEVNNTLYFTAECFDPDVQYGQVLNYTWTSNISGVLGWGPNLEVEITDAGTHHITVTVSDPDFVKEDSIEIYIEPKGDVGPPITPDDDDETAPINWTLIVAIIAVLGILGAVMFIVFSKRKTEAYEADMDSQMEEEEKRESLKRAHDAIKDLADEWEGDAKAEAAGWETEGPEYEEVKMDAPRAQLSMEAKVTEGPSEDVAKLWSGISEVEAEKSEEEKESLHLENLKRKYQNAIGRLPYGIPSKELQGMEWVAMANLLATGEKKQVEGGKEITHINGRWYYSDHEDTGTFLKEHGAKPKEEPKRTAVPTADRDVLLSKLEERFIIGEISEETYRELKKKYEG